MLLQQLHIRDRHAPIHRLAHVIDGQQGNVGSQQGFHFDAGGADGFYRGRAAYAGVLMIV